MDIRTASNNQPRRVDRVQFEGRIEVSIRDIVEENSL
jgi:hypothetical protein